MSLLDNTPQTTNESNSTTLTVFSLNCWGIWYVSKDRVPRMEAIAAHLSQKNYDFVCLQELWVEDDFQLIKNKVKKALPYSHYFYSGFVGSGVCIFSRWPIKEVLYHQWQLNGYFHKISHGDWFGGKGIAFIQCIVNGFTVNVYSVHLHAEYNFETDKDIYLCHRIIQAFDLSQFIRITSQSADLAILAGDLNAQPSQLCYRLVLSNSNMCDAFDNCVTELKKGTYNYVGNTYKEPKGPADQRIDHIMYKVNSRRNIQFVSFDQPLPDLVPNQLFSYSDHDAITATFRLFKESMPGDQADGNLGKEDEHQRRSLEEAVTICELALKKLQTDKAHYISFTLFFAACISIFSITCSAYLHMSLFVIIIVFPLSFCLVFYGFMTVFWVRMETNGILNGYHSLKIALSRTKNGDPIAGKQ